MSDHKTFRYPSSLGATRLITAAHYLTEFILIRHATNKKLTLPNRIWQKKYYEQLQWRYWYGLYHGEHKRATKLLKDFELNDIIEALKTNEGTIILSLTNKNLRRLIKDVQRIQEVLEKTKDKIELTVTNPTTLPRKNTGKKNKLGKLK